MEHTGSVRLEPGGGGEESWGTEPPAVRPATTGYVYSRLFPIGSGRSTSQDTWQASEFVSPDACAQRLLENRGNRNIGIHECLDDSGVDKNPWWEQEKSYLIRLPLPPSQLDDSLDPVPVANFSFLPS
jgi:hypothetical protein